MGEGMHMTTNAHKPKGLDVEVLRAGVARAAVPWKPAGPAAMLRMAAATEYLVVEAESQWNNAGAAWAGTLLGKMGIFVDTKCKKYFVSFGFQKWVALACPVSCKECDGATFFVLEHVEVVSVVNHSCTEESPFRGVPVELVGPNRCPKTLMSAGIVWRQISEPLPLVQYVILCKSMLSQPALAAICLGLRIAVTRMPGDKGITRLAYATALVHHAFPEEPKETHCALIHGIMHGEKFHVGDQLLGKAAVEVMDPQNKVEFEHMFDFAARAAGEGGADQDSDGEGASIQKGQCDGRGRGRGAGRGRKLKSRKRGSQQRVPNNAGEEEAAPAVPEPPFNEPSRASPEAVGGSVQGGRPSSDTGQGPNVPGSAPDAAEELAANVPKTLFSDPRANDKKTTFIAQARERFSQSGKQGPWRNFTPACIKHLLPEGRLSRCLHCVAPHSENLGVTLCRRSACGVNQ